MCGQTTDLRSTECVQLEVSFFTSKSHYDVCCPHHPVASNPTSIRRAHFAIESSGLPLPFRSERNSSSLPHPHPHPHPLALHRTMSRLSGVSAPAAMLVSQLSFQLAPHPRGCHLITSEVRKAIGSHLSWVSHGTLHLFIQHTSASLTINENADSDVRADLEMWLNAAVSEKTKWKHDDEGSSVAPSHTHAESLCHSATVPQTSVAIGLSCLSVCATPFLPVCVCVCVLVPSDDMPAHVKSSLLGCSVTVPISRGALNLGTWQGIWLGEHRDDGGSRRIVVRHACSHHGQA